MLYSCMYAVYIAHPYYIHIHISVMLHVCIHVVDKHILKDACFLHVCTLHNACKYRCCIYLYKMHLTTGHLSGAWSENSSEKKT